MQDFHGGEDSSHSLLDCGIM